MLVGWFGIWDWVCQRLRFNCVLAIPPLTGLAWCGVVCLVCGLLVCCLYVCLFGSMGLDTVGWLVWDLGLCVSKVAV